MGCASIASMSPSMERLLASMAINRRASRASTMSGRTALAPYSSRPKLPPIYIATSNSFLPGAGDQFGNLTTRKLAITVAIWSPKNFRMMKSALNGRWPRACSSPAPFSSSIDPISLSWSARRGGANIGEQVGLTRTRGGELSLTGYVTDEWQISAGWGHQIARIVDAGTSSNEGNEVPFVPNNIYSLWNRYQFTPLFGAGLGIIHQDSSFARPITPSKSPPSPASMPRSTSTSTRTGRRR